MPITVNVTHDTAFGVLAELKELFPQLSSGLPPMQEQPSRDPLPPENVKEIEPPKQRKPRAVKEAPAAEEVKTEDKGESAPTAENHGASGGESQPASTAEKSAEIPDIEDLRARLKTLGATEGFGTDKVFEVLGKYGAKNASTVPEDKRAACIAEIDGILAGAK